MNTSIFLLTKSTHIKTATTTTYILQKNKIFYILVTSNTKKFKHPFYEKIIKRTNFLILYILEIKPENKKIVIPIVLFAILSSITIFVLSVIFKGNDV